jgi:serralysin
MASNIPSADEQLLLELVNRFRMAPAAEAALLTGAGAQSDVLGAINFFGVSVSAFQSALAALSPVAPLAWNENLANSADGHNQAMITADEQTHQAAGEPGLGQRATNAGYSYSTLGENVFAFATNVVNAHAGFIIDWGYDAEDYSGSTLLPNYRQLGDGMQDPAGHRVNLINASYTEIGISLTGESNSATSVGPLVVTEDLGARFGYQAQFVGVVINDLDHDHFYDVGEGLGGVTVTLRSGAATYVTTTWASGGYQIAVPSGTYSITFSGGALTAPVTHQATLGSVNVKVDAEAGSGGGLVHHPANDFNGDGRSDILWRNDNGQMSDWLGTASGGFIDNAVNAYTFVPTDWQIQPQVAIV